MGHIEHDLIVVTGADIRSLGDRPEPDVAAFRDGLPEQWRPLVVGPFGSVTNGYRTWLFLPDGSKSGWDTDADGDRYREQFIDLFSETHSDGSKRWDVVELTYGDDHRHDYDEPEAHYA